MGEILMNSSIKTHPVLQSILWSSNFGDRDWFFGSGSLGITTVTWTTFTYFCVRTQIALDHSCATHSLLNFDKKKPSEKLLAMLYKRFRKFKFTGDYGNEIE